LVWDPYPKKGTPATILTGGGVMDLEGPREVGTCT
jgi:hypothetical protein